MNEKKRYVSEQYLAQTFDISVKTWQRWRFDGKGPSYKKLGTGRTAAIRYDLDEVQRWLDSCPTGGQQSSEREARAQ